MGSSAMAASMLRDKAEKAGVPDLVVENKSINEIPDDADVVITHKDLTDRARQKLSGAHHVSVDNFLDSARYDELVQGIAAEIGRASCRERVKMSVVAVSLKKKKK